MGSWEHSNEPWGSIKGREFLNQLSGYKLLKNDRVLWSQSHQSKATPILCKTQIEVY